MFKIYISILILMFSISGYSQKSKLVIVEGGTFDMGSVNANYPDEAPVHKVTVSTFYMAKYEVLYEDFSSFCTFAGFNYATSDKGFPAVNVTWENAIMYCNWLSGNEGLEHVYAITREGDKFLVKCNFTANGYRLPTEAEWEYAAKGGIRNKGFNFSGSNSPANVAWFNETAKGLPQKLGELEPNEIGLYDMSGNVAEWCWDNYSVDYYKKSPALNPTGPETSLTKVIKGGNRKNLSDLVKVSRRFYLTPKEKDLYTGFRIVRSNIN